MELLLGLFGLRGLQRLEREQDAQFRIEIERVGRGERKLPRGRQFGVGHGLGFASGCQSGIRERLARLRLQVGRKLMGLGFTPWDAGAFESDEGMFLWLALPTGRRGQPLAADIAFAAETAGLVLAPGNVFSPDGNWPHHLRFNVAQCQDPRVFSILKQLLG